MTNLQLIGAREAGKILGVNANMNAIEAFLERFRNTDTPVLE